MGKIDVQNVEIICNALDFVESLYMVNVYGSWQRALRIEAASLKLK